MHDAASDQGQAAFARLATPVQSTAVARAVIALDNAGCRIGLLDADQSFQDHLPVGPARPAAVPDCERVLAMNWLANVERQASELAVCEVRMIQHLLHGWRKRVLVYDALLWFAWLVLWIPVSHLFGSWSLLTYEAAWFYDLKATPFGLWPIIISFFAGCVALHYLARYLAIRSVLSARQLPSGDRGLRVQGAFLASTGLSHSVLSTRPRSWDEATREDLLGVIKDTHAVREAISAGIHSDAANGDQAPAH